MKRNTLMLLMSMVMIVSLVLTACQQPPAPPAVPTAAPAEPTAAPAEPTAAPAEPTAAPAEPTAVPEPTEVVEPTPEPVTRHGGWFDEVVFSAVDAASAVTQITSNAIDIYASGVASDKLPEIEKAGLPRASSNGLYYELTFNPVGPVFESTGKVNPFNDARAREAMNWLIDRDYINREVYNGGALSKFFSIVTQFPDYATNAQVVRTLESKYAYDLEKAEKQMDEVMLGIDGVTKEGGKYMYKGEQVPIILLIRPDSDGTRKPIGDYVADQLESIGFATDRQYKTASEASPIWVGGNPADGLFHIYTGAWSATIIDRDEGDNFQFFDTPQSEYGFSALWQAFNPTQAYMDLADKLAYNRFSTREERNQAMAEMLEMAMTESIHVWLIDGKNYVPYKEGLDVTYDLAAGVDGSQIWPVTLRWADKEGGQLRWAATDVYVDPWNPLAGSNWAFDASIQRATRGSGYMIDPYTGLLWPNRIERAEITAEKGLPIGKTLDWISLDFADEIKVPEDAIVDWDAANQKFITAAEKFPEGTTAKIKSVVYYPKSLWTDVKYHDGSPITLADFIYSWIVSIDAGKEESKIYDASIAENVAAVLENYKGFKIVSEDPLVIEAYSDAYEIDAELDITTMWPEAPYGEMPWPTTAIAALVDEEGNGAFSADKADTKSSDTKTVEWLNYIGGPSLDLMSEALDKAIEEKYVPYANAMSAYLTPDEAVARYEAVKAFKEKYGHFWIGSGPYLLKEVHLTEKVGTLASNPDYADLSDRWSMFGLPKIAEVEVEGEGSVVLGGEFSFDVNVSFEGEPYPADEISRVFGLLTDATGNVIASIPAELVEDGHYVITVPADLAATMEAGAAKIEAVVVPLPVAIPTFASFEFVTIK